MLGIVQGLTEFLPISSTGHLRIVPALGWEDPGAAFTAVTQLGTMAAVLLYFRQDLSRIARGLAAVAARPLGRAVAGSTRASAGTSCSRRSRSGSSAWLFKDQIETGARDLYLIGTRADRARPGAAVGGGVGTRDRGIEQIEARDGRPSASPRRWR